jgi:hypothetical protein
VLQRGQRIRAGFLLLLAKSLNLLQFLKQHDISPAARIKAGSHSQNGVGPLSQTQHGFAFPDVRSQTFVIQSQSFVRILDRVAEKTELEVSSCEIT